MAVSQGVRGQVPSLCVEVPEDSHLKPATEYMQDLGYVREWTNTGRVYGPLHHPLPEESWVTRDSEKNKAHEQLSKKTSDLYEG